MESFCNYVLLFGSMKSAGDWTQAQPGTFVISLDEGLELARRHTARILGAALPDLGRYLWASSAALETR